MLLQTLTTFSGQNQRIYNLVKAVLDDALVAGGRWTSERTLVRYVQVEIFLLAPLSLGNASASIIRELATLAPSFFANVLPDPPPSPATTESTEREG